MKLLIMMTLCYSSHMYVQTQREKEGYARNQDSRGVCLNKLKLYKFCTFDFVFLIFASVCINLICICMCICVTQRERDDGITEVFASIN